MSIPINGRIAILDDQIEQVEILIAELSKRNCPTTYYPAELKYLPEENSNNDIRLLFLDIHLVGDQTRTDKETKSILINYLSRLISEDNFPYLLIYWSRHEDEYKELVENDIFENDLKDRKPIAFLSLNKKDFFNDDNSTTKKFEEKVSELFNNLEDLIKGIPVYDYILDWENNIHRSTDKTIEEVFNKTEDVRQWENDCNYLFKQLGESYSGKTYADLSKLEKIKSTFFSLNIILSDDLDHHTINYDNKSPSELSHSGDVNKEAISTINRKLLTSKEIVPKEYPGTVILDKSERNRRHYLKILEKSLKKDNKEDKISESLIPALIVVSPLCDYVQKKDTHIRLVRGIFINSINPKVFWNNESTYVSPYFEFYGDKKMLMFNFSGFFTRKTLNSDYLEPIFRVRQQLLAEIQSRLSRHINRQGILSLYE